MADKGTLMVSISGIRGIFGDGLDAGVLVKYTAAFGTWCRRRAGERGSPPVVVVGRDARVTGDLCARLVTATLQSTGCDVIDAGLATTPTVEYGVILEDAVGGIILSASHNPANWNALKLLGLDGEFLTAEEGEEVIRIAEEEQQVTVGYEELGGYTVRNYLEAHINAILDLPYIDASQIAERGFKVVVDGINSVGAIAIPQLLKRMGLGEDQIVVLNGEVNGRFAHTPEPLPENLTETIQAVADEGADLGIVVDPDADRLALITDGGHYLSEELTQVVAADFLLRVKPGPFVTNLSSSRAIEDVARQFDVPVYRSAVGEANVVAKMKETGAVLGGEGNGGIILPDIHYGRDALIGVAMVLQHLVNQKASLSELKSLLPAYTIVKSKVPLGNLDADALLAQMALQYRNENISTIDGVKIDFDEGWVHLRKSNTEPILRIYTEAATREDAERLAARFKEELLGEDTVDG